MAKEVFIPQLGQTVEQVTLIRWLVADGAPVEAGEGLLEVETDKALFTLEATAGGHLHRGPYQEGDCVPVLTVVAVIGAPEEHFAPRLPRAAQPAAPALPAGVSAPPPTPGEEPGAAKVFASPRARRLAAARQIDLSQVTPTGNGGQRVTEQDVQAYLARSPRATPVARRVASEADVDLHALAGSGPGGRITREDVERARVAPPSPPEPEVLERLPLKGVRGIIAERMATSAQTAASVALLIEADATEFVALRERLAARVAAEWGFAPGYNDLLAKIVAAALRKFPYMNARLSAPSGDREAAIELLAHINLGLATDTERGLLVPVVRDADQKSLRQFGSEFRRLVDQARNAKSLPDDLSGGTFTITNLGMYDILAFTPLINLPEAAILGVGRITPRPVARGSLVKVRQMWMLSLVFDHRLVDGAPAARFLQYIKDSIETPDLWLAENL